MPRIGKVQGRSSSSRFLDEGKPREKLERLPLLRSVSSDEVEALVLKKLKQCRVVFDFTKPLSDVGQKDIKRDALLELVEYFSLNRGFLTVNIYKEITEMIAVNLFRPLPPHLNPMGAEYDPEEDEPILEAAWPHIQLVYELFLRFIESPEFNHGVAKQFVTKSFVLQLIELFGSEDPRERDYLKTTLHRIYGKFLALRSFIRKSIKSVFATFVYETERHNGIAELLEILGSIINGFTLPLKPEHTDFLMKALLPLHTPKSLSLYHPQLSYCVTQFIEKDPGLVSPIFRKLFRYWPIVNSSKELLFLTEVEDILSILEPEQFQPIIPILFKRYALCVSSLHFQVAEKALTIWNNERIWALVADHLEEVLPYIFESLYHNSKHHWHKSIRPMAWYSLKVLMEMDPDVFNAHIQVYQEANQPSIGDALQQQTVDMEEEEDEEEDEIDEEDDEDDEEDDDDAVTDETGETGESHESHGSDDDTNDSQVDLSDVPSIPHINDHTLSHNDQEDDPELKALQPAKDDKRINRKSILPIDTLTIAAIADHPTHDDLNPINNDSDEENPAEIV
jgi:serine/threonine-protein phosphatase 2A regulatory subunit B'